MEATPHFRHGLGRRNASGSPGRKANTAEILAAGVRTPAVRGTGIDDECEGLANVNLHRLAVATSGCYYLVPLGCFRLQVSVAVRQAQRSGYIQYYIYTRFPLGMCMTLNIAGVASLKGETLALSVARFTCIVPPLLLLRRCCTAWMLLKFIGVDWNLFLVDMCSAWHTHIIRTYALTEAPFVAVTKRKIPRSTATVIPWLPQRQKLTV